MYVITGINVYEMTEETPRGTLSFKDKKTPEACVSSIYFHVYRCDCVQARDLNCRLPGRRFPWLREPGKRGRIQGSMAALG